MQRARAGQAALDGQVVQCILQPADQPPLPTMLVLSVSRERQRGVRKLYSLITDSWSGYGDLCPCPRIFENKSQL